MTEIRCIHLSDIHINEEDSETDIRSVIDPLLKDIDSRIEGVSEELENIDLIFITGDIAYHGLEREYSFAEEVFFKPLYEVAGIAPERVFVVPGNHDIVRASYVEGLLDDTRKDITESESPNSFLELPVNIEYMMDRFKHYYAFIKRNLGHLIQPENGLCWANTLDFSDFNLGILGLNSAWLSWGGKEKDYGRLYIGEKQVVTAINATRDANFRICLAHHPFDWIHKSEDRSRCDKRLREACSLYLHGHDHTPNIEVSTTLDGKIVFIPAGAMYEEREFPNSYSYQMISPLENRATIYLRRYDSRSFRWHPDSTLAGNPRGFRVINLEKTLKASNEEMLSLLTKQELARKFESFNDRKGRLVENVTQSAPSPSTMPFGLLVGPLESKREVFPLSETWVKELGWLAPDVSDIGVYNDYVLLKHRISAERSEVWGGNIWPTGHLQVRGEFVPKRETLDLVEVASIILKQALFNFKALRIANWTGVIGIAIIIRDIGTRELQAYYNNHPELNEHHVLPPEQDRIIYEVRDICKKVNDAVELCMDLVSYIAREFAFNPSPQARKTVLKYASRDVDLESDDL